MRKNEKSRAFTQEEKDAMPMKNDAIEIISGSRPNLGVFKTVKTRTTLGGVAEPYDYKRESIDTTGYAKGKSNYELKTEEGKADKTGYNKITSSKSKTVNKKDVPSVLKKLKN